MLTFFFFFVSLFVATQLIDAINHPDDEKEIRQAFDKYDKDGNGTIDRDELINLGKDIQKLLGKGKKEGEEWKTKAHDMNPEDLVKQWLDKNHGKSMLKTNIVRSLFVWKPMHDGFVCLDSKKKKNSITNTLLMNVLFHLYHTDETIDYDEFKSFIISLHPENKKEEAAE